MDYLRTDDHEILERQRIVDWINTTQVGSAMPPSRLLCDGTISLYSMDLYGQRVDHVQTLSEARALLGF